MNMFAQAEAQTAAFLNDPGFFASSVDYRRGAETLAAGIMAVPGAVTPAVVDEYGAVLTAETHDFLFAGTLPVTPQVGDLIIHAGRRYQVTQAAAAECYETVSREAATVVKVHTYLAGEAHDA